MDSGWKWEEKEEQQPEFSVDNFGNIDAQGIGGRQVTNGKQLTTKIRRRKRDREKAVDQSHDPGSFMNMLIGRFTVNENAGVSRLTEDGKGQRERGLKSRRRRRREGRDGEGVTRKQKRHLLQG